MKIVRQFNHRSFGAIGSVTLDADAKLTLDGVALGADSVEYLLNFALQSLQDAYAGAKDLAEAQASWAKKLDAIKAGTVGVRAGGGGVAPEVSIARQIVRAKVKAKLGAKSPEWAAFTGLSDAAQAEKLDAVYAANKEALEAEVHAELKRREDQRKRMAKLELAIEL